MSYEDWVRDAACRGRDDIDWWSSEVTAEAVALCGRCPVRAECVLEALERHHKDDAGVWAGTSVLDRLRIRRGDFEVWELWAAQGHPYTAGEGIVREG